MYVKTGFYQSNTSPACLIVLVLELVLVIVLDLLELGLLPLRSIDHHCVRLRSAFGVQRSKTEYEDESIRVRLWERLRGRRAARSKADFVGTEAIDQSSKHRHDASEHLLTGANPILRDEALRNRSIETGRALDGRATRVVEKLGPLTAVTLTRFPRLYSEVPKGLRGRAAQTTRVGVEPNTERHRRRSRRSRQRTGVRDSKHPVFHGQIEVPQRCRKTFI